MRCVKVATMLMFQFTHPGRGATHIAYSDVDLTYVSIHAPREGCDRVAESVKGFFLSFNSRTPGGVRLQIDSTILPTRRVSIHAPREGCDCSLLANCYTKSVSIHAPREGCDYRRCLYYSIR